MNIQRGNAVVVSGSNAVGIVTTVDRGQGLAWVVWPDGCGLSDCVPIGNLQTIADRSEITAALQVIAPVQQLNEPLERAFINSARSRASSEIVEYDDNLTRPYYSPKVRR